MATNAKLVYKHILLKLSGEALQGTEGFSIDAGILDRIAQEVKELVELGIQVGVVIGGGNLFRGTDLAKAGMSCVVGDHMGVPVTIVNGSAIRDILHRAHVNVRLISAIPLDGVCDSYSQAGTISLLRNNCVVILSAGTGNPFFTIDSAACLRDIEIEADVVLKATKVDDVFTADPTEDSTAIMYEQLAYGEVLEKELKVTDLAVLTFARDHRLPVRVFNMNESGALRRVVMGEKKGTLITE